MVLTETDIQVMMVCIGSILGMFAAYIAITQPALFFTILFLAITGGLIWMYVV